MFKSKFLNSRRNKSLAMQNLFKSNDFFTTAFECMVVISGGFGKG